MAESGELKKMVIDAHRKADYSDRPVTSFTVMFNPNTYTQKYEVTYEERQGQGDTSSPQVYGNIKPQEYTFEFLFDGTGTAPMPDSLKSIGQTDSTPETNRYDVQKIVDEFLTVTGKHDGEIHRPLYLRLSWGSLSSKCVLTNAEITYTLFRSDGTPLRAKVKATFSENVEDTLRVAEERESSPDLSHVRTVREGDHLTLMTDRLYDDPTYYLQVARANGLTNFRRLRTGSDLVFPPVRERTT